MSTESAGGPAKMRASDGEREEYARIVRDAVGEGRLSLAEGEERLATLYAAKFRDELPPVVADLPRDEEPRGYGRGSAGPARGSRSTSGGRGGERGRDWQAYGRRGFARHIGFVAVVAGILIAIWALTASSFFWPAIPLAFLAFGLLRRGCWLGWSRGAGRRQWYGDYQRPGSDRTSESA